MTEPARLVVVAGGPDPATRLLAVVPDEVPTTVVLLGECDGAAAAAIDVDEVVVVPDLAPGAPPDAVGAVVGGLLDGAGTLVVDGTQAGRDLAGWAAAVLDAALVWGVDELRLTPEGLTSRRMVLGGSHRMVQVMEGEGVAVVIATPRTDPRVRAAGRRPAVRFHRVAQPPAAVRVRRAPSDTAGTTGGWSTAAPELTSAHIVVGVGRGIGGPEHVPLFRDLAARLGAALGATRAVVDAGWLPFAHQVGQTGAVVAPDLYLAFGISGAIQHLAGMRDSRRVVAVNTDPDAALCRLADLVVTADARRVARELVDRLPAAAPERGPPSDATRQEAT